MIGCDYAVYIGSPARLDPDGPPLLLPLATYFVLYFNPPLWYAAACKIFCGGFPLLSLYQDLVAGLFAWERRNW